MKWTNPAHVELLKELWPSGLSAAQISAALAREFSDACYTRSAIIGKAHRLGLSGREKPATPQRAPLKPPSKPGKTRQFSRIALTPPVAPVIPSLPRPERSPPVGTEGEPAGENSCTLMELSANRCRWPIGPLMQPAELFCGEAFTTEGRDEKSPPYCDHHLDLSVQPGQRKLSAAELARSLRRWAA